MNQELRALEEEKTLYQIQLKKDIELPLFLRYSRWIQEIEWEIQEIKKEIQAA